MIPEFYVPNGMIGQNGKTAPLRVDQVSPKGPEIAPMGNCAKEVLQRRKFASRHFAQLGPIGQIGRNVRSPAIMAKEPETELVYSPPVIYNEVDKCMIHNDTL